MKSNVYWDSSTGKTVVDIPMKDGSIVTGKSFLHPDDLDLGGELTGAVIASQRAQIAYIKKEIAEHKSRLVGIEHCLSILNQSQKTDINSYEYKTINRQAMIESDYIDELKKLKNHIELDLTAYIQSKDVYYKKVRENRQKGK